APTREDASRPFALVGEGNMAKHGKRYHNNLKKVEAQKKYTLDEAVGILKQFTPGKFDETVDLAMRLGVDPKHADQQVRGAVVMPKGIGKTVRVVVFAKGEKEKE